MLGIEDRIYPNASPEQQGFFLYMKNLGKHRVLNSQIGSPYNLEFNNLNEQQSKVAVSELFEQLLIYDNVSVATNKRNAALIFLIERLGINTVERLVEHGYITFLLWSPLLITYGDGYSDDNKLKVITAAEIGVNYSDPEENIDEALKHFDIARDRKRIFKRIARDRYQIPAGMNFAKDAADIIIDAYERDNLRSLGMPCEKNTSQFTLSERKRLMALGNSVLNTLLLTEYKLKSYQDFSQFELFRENVKNIGRAYNIKNDSDLVFKLENVPNLAELYKKESLNFDSFFELKNLSSAKYYRKWINTIGEHFDASKISKEYLNEIKGKGNFFEKTQGKFVKSLISSSIGAVLGHAISGAPGLIAGMALSVIETIWIDNILRGSNPSMFIEDIEKSIKISSY